MAVERRPRPDSGLDELGEESTLPEDEWPVDQRYLEPVPAAADEAVEQTRREEAGEVAPLGPGRTGVPAAIVVALLAALLLLGSATAWIALKGSGSGAASQGTLPQTGNGAPATTSSTTTDVQEQTEATAVPELTGLALADAREALAAAGFRVSVREERSDEPRGQVLRQAPDAGEDAERRSLVVLTVSSGPGGTNAADEQARIDVPNVIGLRSSTAVSKLRALDLVPHVTLVSSSRRVGTIVSQSPAGNTIVAAQSTVQLRAARRPEVVKVSVPNLVGLTAAAARRKLAAAGLGVAVQRAASDEPEGSVIDQEPTAGAEVRKQTTVRITVSSGPATVTVPSVVGLSEASARDQLESAGFVVQTQDEPTTDPSRDGEVTNQSPTGGAQLAEGSTVVLTIARVG
jgi:beta-lactam-binding protein with PASTA domain